jgi:uncharacterized membrane protein
MRRHLGRDSGQIMLLVLIYALIAGSLVMVAVDAGSVFLHRRSLAAAADGAALAAAQSLDRSAFYRHGADGALLLDADAAAAAVDAYVDASDLTGRFDDLTYDTPVVSADGTTVTVRLHATAHLPFTGSLTGGRRTVTLDAAASAESTTG